MESKKVVQSLRHIAKDSASARAVFGWLSEYTNNVLSSSVEHFEQQSTRWGRLHLDDQMTVTRKEAIAIMKQLDELMLGRFIVGRRGSDTRFEFWTPRSHIGKAAMGEIERIDIHEEDVALENDEIIEMHRTLLANALELPVSAIRIKIKE